MSDHVACSFPGCIASTLDGAPHFYAMVRRRDGMLKHGCREHRGVLETSLIDGMSSIDVFDLGTEGPHNNDP